MKDRKVRFVKATVETSSDSCHARVELERTGAGTYVGTSGATTGLDAFRAGAQAAALAVEQVADSDDAHVEVCDLEVVKLFGDTLVIVSVLARLKDETRSVYGVCQVRDDGASAAALAVLNATNRIFDLA